MKKILLLFVLYMSFSVTACADSDIDKIKGCWKHEFGTIFKITDNEKIKLSNNEIFNIEFSSNDTHIIYTMWHPKIEMLKETVYINKKSITDTSFVQSKKPQTDPTKGLKYTRIECPR